MRKLLFTFVLLLCLPFVGHAQQVTNIAFAVKYNLNSTSVIYCKVTGQGGSTSDAGGISNPYRIKTTGSSQDVTEFTAGTNPFTELAVNDIIQVTKPDGTGVTVSIKTRTDAANVVVSDAIDLSAGYRFTWFRQTCGTGAEDGWLSVEKFQDKSLVVQYDQGDLTGGLNVQMQCMGAYPGAQPVQVFPACDTGACGTVQNYATASIGIASRTNVVAYEPYSRCRVGLYAQTGDPSDATTNAEIITVGLMGTPRR